MAIRQAHFRGVLWRRAIAFLGFMLIAPGVAQAQSFTMTITGPAQPVGPGTVQPYQLTIDNPLGQTLTQVQLVLSLANGLLLDNPAALGCASPGGVQLCDVAPAVAPSGQLVLPFDVRMPTVITPPQQTFAIAYSGTASNPATASGGTVSATVSVARTLSFSGTASPAPVVSGGAFAYQIEQTIGGPNPDWTGITIQLTAPAQVSLGAASGSGFNCTGSTSIQTCTSTIAALGQTLRNLNVPATAAVVPANTAGLAQVTASGSFLTGGNGSIGQTILAAPLDLALSQALDSSTPVAPGSDARFRLRVDNLSVTGGPSASGFQVTSTLPAGLSFSAASGAGWSCSGSGVVVCTHAPALAPGAASSDLLLTTTSAPTVSGLLTNNAVLTAAGDSNPANNQASASVSFDVPNLQLSQTGPATARVGDALQYQLLLRNAGTAPTAPVLVENNLPAALELIGATGEGCASGNPVRCQLSALPAGAQRTISIAVRARQPGTVTNTATASDGVQALSAAVTTVIAATDVDVALRKSGPARVQPGAQVDYQLEVQNLGTTPAREVRVVDALPPGLSLLSASGAGWTCGGTPLTCTLDAELAGGGSAAPIRLETRLADSAGAGVLLNTAQVSAVDDRNPGNDSAAASTQIEVPEALADLTLTLVAQQPSYAPDGIQEQQFAGLLRNAGPQTATRIQLSGNVDAQDAGLIELVAGEARCTTLANCALPDLAAGASVSVLLRLRVNTDVSPSVRVLLAVAANQTDPRPADNSASASGTRLSFDSCCDLAVGVSGPAAARVGTDAQLTVTVRNFGVQPATGATLQLTGTRLRISAVTGASCPLGEEAISTTCTLAAVPPSGVLSVQLTVRPTEAGAGSLQAAVNSNSGDPDLSNNSETLRLSIDAAPPEVITTVVQQSADPVVQSVAPAVGQVCSSGSATLQAQCQAIASANSGADAEAVIRSLLPEEILSQGTSVDQLAQVQFDNVNSRVAELRSGDGGGFSAEGLSLGLGGQVLPVGLLRSLFANAAQDEGDEPAIGESGELISRWGGFVNGSITRGNAKAGNGADTLRDFDAIGVTAGVDYRRSVRWVLGGAIGYSRFDSGLADAGTLETRALTLTAYSLINPTERWYVDTRLSLGRSRMETSRRVFVPGVVDTTAFGDTDITQLSAAIATGYTVHRGGWNFTPNASLRYLRSEFDAFTETGAGDNNAQIAEQSQYSAQLATGFQVSRALSLRWGVLVPQLDLSITRELNDEGFELDAALVGAPNVRIRTRADAPDQLVGHAGAGIVLVAANGRQFYLSYRRLLGDDGKESGTFNLGGRFEF